MYSSYQQLSLTATGNSHAIWHHSVIILPEVRIPPIQSWFKNIHGLLTGHAKLNGHLTFIQIHTDAVCPLCQENEETVLHLLGECSGLSAKRLNILGSPYLSYEELGNVHWQILLRLAKASQHFFYLFGLCDCALGPPEAPAQMVTSPAKNKNKKKSKINFHQLTSHSSLRRHALQYGHPMMTIDCCDVTSTYATNL